VERTDSSAARKIRHAGNWRRRGTPVVMLSRRGHRIRGFGQQGVRWRLRLIELKLAYRMVPLVGAILAPDSGPALLASLCDYVVAVRGIATFGWRPGLVRPRPAKTSARRTWRRRRTCLNGTIDAAVDSRPTPWKRSDASVPYASNASADLPVHHSSQPSSTAAPARLRRPYQFRRAYDMHKLIAGLIDADSLGRI